MKKVLLALFATLFLALLVLCSNKEWMQAYSDFRFSHPSLEPDQRKHGDLYGMCFIHKYKESTQPLSLKTYPAKKQNTCLYLLQDSYLQDPLQTTNFNGIDSLIQYDYRNDPLTEILQEGKKNVLVIETAERYARNRFQNPGFFIHQFRLAAKEPSKTPATAQFMQSPKQEQPGLGDKIRSMLVNTHVNSNMEFALFDYTLFSPIRGLKAEINYTLFTRLDNRIAVSRDGSFLLLKETIDSTQSTGIYTKLEDKEIDSMGAHMQVIRNAFLSAGFKEVFFSIIPNTVTLNDSSHFNISPYNGLIYKIKSKAKVLGIPYIDVWELYKQSPALYYKHGDSHWNVKGKQLWLDCVSERIQQLN
jgi:hypothetical protein